MVRKVIQIFYREFSGLHQAAYLLAIFSFGSQLLALIRDRALAHTFGAGVELDLYYTAFRIPDLMFVVFASILSVYVLIPFISKLQKNKDNNSASQLLSQIFTLFLITYSIIATLLFVNAHTILSRLFFNLYIVEPDLFVTIFRILLLQPLLLSTSSLLAVITQIQQKFIVYAISPILYNIGIIIGIFFLYPVFGLQGLAVGVVLGALAHVSIQIPLFLKSTLRFNIKKPESKNLYNVFAVAFPRALTLSLNQLVLLILTIIASGMTIGSVSVFQFAWNLQSVPLTIIGVSYSVAAFPILVKLLAEEQYEKFNNHIRTAFRHIIFWSVPIIILFILLRAHIIRILLGSGNFSWDDTRLTAAVFAIFIISLLAQAINLLSIRAFYAHGDTKTPLKVAIVGSTVTLTFTLLTYFYLYNSPVIWASVERFLRITDVTGSEVIILAVGFTVGVIIQALIMMWLLQKVFNGIFKDLMVTFRNSLTASFVGGIGVYLILNFIVKGINQETFIGISIQAFIAGLFGLLLIYISHKYLNSLELHEIKKALSKRFKTNSVTASE